MSSVCIVDICEDGYTLVYESNGEPTTDCEPCQVGEVKVTAESATCQPCDAGFTTIDEGSTQCYR